MINSLLMKVLLVLLFASLAQAKLPPSSLNEFDPPPPLTEKERKDLWQVIAGGVDGGGEGLVCFSSKEHAEQAFDDSGRIQDHMREHIQQVFSQDLAEHWLFFDPVKPEKNENVISYIERVISQKIAPDTPYLAAQVLHAVHQITQGRSFANWRVRGALEKLDDAGERDRIFEQVGKKLFTYHCRIAQVAIRYEVKDASGNTRVLVDYDKDLFDRMGENDMLKRIGESDLFDLGMVNQAALVLHEAIYFMGSLQGKDTSEFARWLTSHVLKDQPHTTEPDPIASRAQSYHILLMHFGFNRIGFVFLDEQKISSPFSVGARRYTYAFLNGYRLPGMKKHFDRTIKSADDPRWNKALNEAMGKWLTSELDEIDPSQLTPQQTAEIGLKRGMAFLYLVEYYYEKGRTKLFPDGFLLRAYEKQATEAGIASCMRFTHERNGFIKEHGLELVFKQALKYCTSWISYLREQ